MVSRAVSTWQTQDVVCIKCGEDKSDNLAPTCKCGGSFRPALNRADAGGKLRLIQSVAEYHKLAMTAGYVNEVLERW